MKHLLPKVIETLEHLEKRPLMYSSSTNYKTVCDIIFGYFMGIELCKKIDLNNEFINWLHKKTIKRSLMWSDHIYHFMGNEDEEESRKMLFRELSDFLKSIG